MDALIAKARVLVEALPFISDFRGKTVVVKIGGAALEDPTLRRCFAEDLILDGIRQVRLEGGFNAPYDCNTCGENTLLRGSLTIEKGSLILENLTIR